MSEDSVVRLAAIRDRIEVWIQRRIESLRLTPEEKARVKRDLDEFGEKGMAYLESYKRSGESIYDHMDYCPFCEGAARGAGH